MSTYYTILVEEGQSLFDLALQEYGHTDGAYYLLQDNLYDEYTEPFKTHGIRSITDELFPGQQLRLRTSSAGFDSALREYIRLNHIRVNSHADSLVPDGIGYMIVESNFIVR